MAVPSIWRDINEYVKLFFDHSSQNVRKCVANMLAISHSFDITLFNGQSKGQANVKQFFNDI
ncbi:unnamed protein product, partial [Rotaria sp. Silwood1]